MPTSRIMIVNAQYRLVRGLSLLLALEEGAEVVGWATDPEDAVNRASELRPDAVLVQHPLGSSDGIDVAERITSANAEVRVIITSANDVGVDGDRARRAGIERWLSSELPPDILLDEIHAVLR